LKEADLNRVLASCGNAELYGMSEDSKGVDLRQLLSVTQSAQVFKSQPSFLHGVKLNESLNTSPGGSIRRLSFSASELAGKMKAKFGRDSKIKVLVLPATTTMPL
jgi:hypothetical protein